MTGERTCVEFDAPNTRVKRVDSAVEILDTSRTRFLLNALKDKLEELTTDGEFCRRLSDVYYDGRVDYETVEALLGRNEARRLKLLRASIDQTSAIPELKNDLPSNDAFYDGEVSEWTPSNLSESSDSA
ncbi:hypothetical protein [Halobellus rarus]|uniref:Uncharacterized protein n=1 Tax=Halobellus rarus TaxID=1126237 RepID=A0ABD6CR28_9EURY|nr:hypothetical protein [Halobellus rarus]